jgi:purine-binding chemotaxis protein CheW
MKKKTKEPSQGKGLEYILNSSRVQIPEDSPENQREQPKVPEKPLTEKTIVDTGKSTLQFSLELEKRNAQLREWEENLKLKQSELDQQFKVLKEREKLLEEREMKFKQTKQALAEKKQVSIEATPSGVKEEDIKIEREVIQYVNFVIHKEEFGISLEEVQEINRCQEVTTLPETPDYIKGIINLRGNIIPIVNLAQLFGFPREEINDQHRIIIAACEGQRLGILVSRVKEITSISRGEINKPSFIMESSGKPYIEGIVNVNGRLITLINLNTLFRQISTGNLLA